MIINSDAYIAERFKFSNTLDPRDFADYQEWERVIARHLYEWEVEQHNKRDRQLAIQQHAVFHTFQAPHIDSNCQERLFFWGPDVEVAVPDPQDSSRWLAKRLSEVQPYYWRNVFVAELEG